MTCLDWSQCPDVESVPGKVSGAWVFKDTRMPVQIIFSNLEAGMSIEEIAEVYEFPAERIRGVVRFATSSLEKEPSYA